MAKKLESTLRNMILSLLLISSVMAAALGFVYGITKDPIENANKQNEIKALRDVLPPFDNDPTTNAKNVDGLTIYTGIQKGQVVGYAVKTFTVKGFSGRFDLMVGYKPDGTINQIAVLEQKETPGLGTKMKEPKFKNQFQGINIGSLGSKQLKVKKDGGTVDAITAATISSRAFCDGVNKSFALYQKTVQTAGALKADTLANGKGGTK